VQPPELLDDAIKAVPGFLGSAFATLFFNEPHWIRRIGVFLAGASLSWYASAWIASRSGMDEGFAGFLVGLFGMSVVKKIFDLWTSFDLSSILSDWIRKVLGLPPKEA
jgi:hypothetical protein